MRSVIDARALDALRARVSSRMSSYRFRHTEGVESMAVRLAALYLPHDADRLRVAALLHDITKELAPAEQLARMREMGIVLRPDEEASPKIWHGITAAWIAERDYGSLADPDILSAIRWHTTGRRGMTLFESLLFLADYIEEGRRFEDCVLLRRTFFDALPERMDRSERLSHLRHTLLLALDATLRELRQGGAPVCLDTEAAYEYLKNENHPFERTKI